MKGLEGRLEVRLAEPAGDRWPSGDRAVCREGAGWCLGGRVSLWR